MAVHDMHYASPAPDWETFVLRMHLIAELRIGAGIRRAEADDGAAFDKAMTAAEGA